MKIGLVCDLHMVDNEKSSQWQFFTRAVRQLKKDGIKEVISLGDITSFGEYGAMQKYIKELPTNGHRLLLGNSDVRNEQTQGVFCALSKSFDEVIDGRRIVGINTPYAKIDEEDCRVIKSMEDGDVLLMHHSVQGLCEESRNFLNTIGENTAITVIHAHSHKTQDYMLGKAHIIGIRALDPDKSIGGYPCITYLDTDDLSIEERCFGIEKRVAEGLSRFFGISCVDNHRDVNYAAENRVFGVELRCNGRGWEPDLTLVPVIEQWRANGGGYLSVHMPNLRWADGEITGADAWMKAVEYAKTVGAQGLTIHPPRVKKCDFPQVWDDFLKLYIYAAESMGDKVKLGIENLHMEKGEKDDDKRCFGYVPAEVSAWIDAINEKLGKPNRVGHTLDVGHARNNGLLSQKFPISRWYEIMGNRTVAYHIHQVVPGEAGMINHAAIENWLGPIISYASFLHCWEKGALNHVPVFLEVKGSENYDKSIKAFNKTFMQESDPCK